MKLFPSALFSVAILGLLAARNMPLALAQDEAPAEEAAPAEDDTVLDGATEAPAGDPGEAASEPAEAVEAAPVGGAQPAEKAPQAPAPGTPKSPAQAPAPAKAVAKPAGKAVPAAPEAAEAAEAAEAEEEAEEEAAPSAAAPAGAAPAAAGGAESASEPAPAGETTNADAPPQFTADGEKRYDLLSDGQRLKLKEGELSIIPPLGWELLTTLPTTTLQATVPSNTTNLKYPRTIQVLRFDGPKFMDDTTATAFEDFITKKYAAAAPGIDAFKVKNHLPIDMTDGRKGLLFYTEFVLGGMPLMQAHILISSQKAHYLLSYTDIAENFENDDQSSRFLTEAWQSMTSVELDTPSPVQFEAIARIGVGFAAFVLLAFAIWAFRNARAKKAYAYYGSGKGLDDVEVTQEPQMVAGKPGAAPVSGLSFHGDDEK